MKKEKLHMTTKPRFEITSLHIRGLRGLRSLDLPQDGLGWDKTFPPLWVVAGANGTGKTTLLRCITQAARALIAPSTSVPQEVDAEECWIDFEISDGIEPAKTIRFLVGDNDFVKKHSTSDCWGMARTGKRPRSIQQGLVVELRKTLRFASRFAASTWPRIVLMPSDDRDLVVPSVSYKAPGSLVDSLGFVAAWERMGPRQWAGSLVELFFSARWADLNANEDRRAQEATHFRSYTRAFADLMGGRKTLSWTRTGELVVKLDDGGTTHPLEELSSGERQAVFLLAELRRRWRPGSLILIDELELHLHDAWQGKLLEILTDMQAELGGQVIITTQSHSLFEMAASGTEVLLGLEHV